MDRLGRIERAARMTSREAPILQGGDGFWGALDTTRTRVANGAFGGIMRNRLLGVANAGTYIVGSQSQH
jgi:hypothetical protein